MRIARKYNLLVDTVISCGLGSLVENATEFNLMDSFTISSSTVTHTSLTYPNINIDQLENLNIGDYNNRVIDFINYSGIESNIDKNNLISGSTFISSGCSDYFCFLNPNFLVYSFLSGIRIVNVGSANGVIEYIVYPEDDDISNYNWQTNPTFLNLNSNIVYIVAIRDHIIDIDIVPCEYQTIISLLLLLPSTTTTLIPKIITLNQITTGSIGNINFNTGCIKINPSSLTIGQEVKINYTANALLSNCGYSCVQFTCQPNGSNTFINQCCITNINNTSPVNSFFTLCNGDIVCYTVTTNACTPGSTACANFCMTGVDGLNTINPSIDITNCSSSVISTQPSTNVTVAMNRTNNSLSPTNDLCTIGGLFIFSPPITIGQCIMIQLSAVTTTIPSSLGSSDICFTCKPNGGSSFIGICDVNSIQPQPQSPILTIRNGDIVCYNETLSVPQIGTKANGYLCINSLTASYGINPILNNLNKCDGTSITKMAIPVIVSLCNQNSTTESPNSCGFINTNVAIPSGQIINTNFSYSVNIFGSASGSLSIFCKPNGGSSFVNKCNIPTTNVSSGGIGTFTIDSGDILCYNLIACKLNCSSTVQTTLNLTTVTSSSGVLPSINNSKCSDYASSGL